MISDFDHFQMHQAIQLALKAGRTSPNPPVGAVITRGKKILATGYHRGPGKPHAEIEALSKLKGRVRGATLYVTLEPCCHTDKRTPPCVNSIVQSGISRVVVGRTDPNPQVNGKGIRFLKSRGIRVETGCLSEDCYELTRAYEKWIVKGIPFILLKAALTLDGKIATARGESHWITGEPARIKVHELRSQADAILVGFNTVLKDDPLLTVRHTKGSNPLRVVLDSHLRLPFNRKVFNEQDKIPTVIAALAEEKENQRVMQLQKKGIQFIFCRPNRQGRVDLNHLFSELGKRGVTSVMVEAGSALSSALIENGEIDELCLFLAPKILGGSALDLFGDLKVAYLKSAPQFEILGVEPVGEDLFVRLGPV
jgi:diaminohydroxyphosphoribosylaminopyrimidine deaminase/5-amino-6-(5-phosphoribosylamino)uracil reductase